MKCNVYLNKLNSSREDDLCYVQIILIVDKYEIDIFRDGSFYIDETINELLLEKDLNWIKL